MYVFSNTYLYTVLNNQWQYRAMHYVKYYVLPIRFTRSKFQSSPVQINVQ